MDSRACETPLVELLEHVPEDAQAWYEHSPMNRSYIPYGLLCQQAAAEIRSLMIELDQCFHVVREYVSLELADDPSQDDPSCQLYPLIELVRRLVGESTQAPPKQDKPPKTTNR